MNQRGVLWILAANLAALTALALVYPHLMISPGPLIEGHWELTTDCFACHTPWRGSDPQKCMTCHKPEQIGRTTSKGQPILQAKTKVPFHQELRESDCVACHGDHRGVLPYRSIRTFSHGLLAASVQSKCVGCHSRPTDRLHEKLGEDCGQCHGQTHWKPANFSHERLAPAVLERCEGCHQAPKDPLHRGIPGNCGQCHRQDKWKPATFDHDQYFVLDRDHQAECSVCHPKGDFKRYSCYGCHEHSPGKIREEHLEEGIFDYENCVECHRSASEHDIRIPVGRDKGEKRRERERRREGHDDD